MQRGISGIICFSNAVKTRCHHNGIIVFMVFAHNVQQKLNLCKRGVKFGFSTLCCANDPPFKLDFPICSKDKNFVSFRSGGIGRLCKVLSTRSKFVQTSMAFHGNLSKEERSMMLKITGGDSLQTKPTKKEIPSTLRIRKKVPKIWDPQ